VDPGKTGRHALFVPTSQLVLLLMALFIASSAALARSESSNVSKSLARSSAASPATVDGAHFSDPPSDQEILVSGVLPQPLAPIGGAPDARENRTLGRALIQYQRSLGQGAPPDAVGPLTDFLRSHPASRWRAALCLNLGVIYRRTGHMSKALEAWQRAWDLSKKATDANARAIADYAVGQLAEFEAYLGRMETLAPLLAEVKGRPMHGAGAANISAASQGLAEMRTRPQDAFRCGPMALHRICLLQRRTDGVMALENSRSTTRGTSLVQVVELAHKVGLDYRMAYREPGAMLIAPAVMHWKVGHFAAIIKESGGLYQVEDPTFGESIRVSRATLDEEGSGYFVVGAGPLPKGWRPASPAEGARIWGRGNTGGQAPMTPNPVMALGSRCTATGMTTVNAQASTVSLALHDAPLTYQTPRGPPVSFELFYSHRDTQQPAIFTYTNFGPKWTSNWISYITDNFSSTGTADLYAPGGGIESYGFSGDTTPSGGKIYNPGLDDQALVTSLVSAGKTVGFTRQLADGSVQTFARRFATNRFFLSSVADPQGNKVILFYDGFMRITTIRDAALENTTLTYGLAADKYKVTKVTDPFGRFATFTYNSDGQLAGITDTLGITSAYTYLFDSGDFIKSLTTPYGISTFTYGDSTTDYRLGTTIFLTVTDPLGQMQRVEFRQQAPGIPDADPPNTVPTGMPAGNVFLSSRNVFVWNAHQLPLATLPDGEYDYTKARMLHFLHAANFGLTSGVLDSVKEPLENRVWYSYPGSGLGVGGSNLPSATGRVLDDGSTQRVTYQRNSFGLITQFTDPIGRQLTFTYATNGIDPLSVANTTGGTNQLLLSATYNSKHEPLSITDASGQVTKFSYNSTGQLTGATDALGETTGYTYSPTGLLLSVTQPANAVTKFTFDGFNRLRSWTDTQGYQALYTYDGVDRPTSIAYPDATTRRFSYTLLDVASTTDRLTRTTRYKYDSLRRPVQIVDPLGRTVSLGYCDCDAISRISDPLGHTTNINYDIEDRPIARVFADGTRTALAYEHTTSRIKSVTDALAQVISYAYNVDDTPKSIVYLHATHVTPPVSFTWDAAFERILTMTDGTGKTAYSYNPIATPAALGAGLLAVITGPRGDAIRYDYDALGRRVKLTIDGAVSQLGFDPLGRIISDKNPLDTFNLGYPGANWSPTSIQSMNGVASLYTYFGNTGDERLRAITARLHSGAQISNLQYLYDAGGEVKSTAIQRQSGTMVNTLAMSYDSGGELIGVTPSAGGSRFTFGYDLAGNRVTQKIGAATTTYTYNSVNAMTAPGPASYDKDGEPLTLGNATYQWDAANRLTSVTVAGGTTRFAYDGFNRRTRVTRLTGSTVTSDKFYVRCGHAPCLETDGTKGNAVTKRYLSEGVVDNGKPLYYVRDNLGSVRYLVNVTGGIEAAFDYDPFGVRTRIGGLRDSDFGFSDLFHDSQSGLDLAFYRPYRAPLGRWLNRDPLGETQGTNLYAYAANNPASLIDPLGLWYCAVDYGGAIGGHLVVGASGGAGTGFIYGTSKCGGRVLKPYTQTNRNFLPGLGYGGGIATRSVTISCSPFGDVEDFEGESKGVNFTGGALFVKGTLGVYGNAPPPSKADVYGPKPNNTLGFSVNIGFGPQTPVNISVDPVKGNTILDPHQYLNTNPFGDRFR
jgi:RHS repeat-associated protein